MRRRARPGRWSITSLSGRRTVEVRRKERRTVLHRAGRAAHAVAGQHLLRRRRPAGRNLHRV